MVNLYFLIDLRSIKFFSCCNISILIIVMEIILIDWRDQLIFFDYSDGDNEIGNE